MISVISRSRQKFYEFSGSSRHLFLSLERISKYHNRNMLNKLKNLSWTFIKFLSLATRRSKT